MGFREGRGNRARDQPWTHCTPLIRHHVWLRYLQGMRRRGKGGVIVKGPEKQGRGREGVLTGRGERGGCPSPNPTLGADLGPRKRASTLPNRAHRHVAEACVAGRGPGRPGRGREEGKADKGRIHGQGQSGTSCQGLSKPEMGYQGYMAVIGRERPGEARGVRGGGGATTGSDPTVGPNPGPVPGGIQGPQHIPTESGDVRGNDGRAHAGPGKAGGEAVGSWGEGEVAPARAMGGGPIHGHVLPGAATRLDMVRPCGKRWAEAWKYPGMAWRRPGRPSDVASYQEE